MVRQSTLGSPAAETAHAQANTSANVLVDGENSMLNLTSIDSLFIGNNSSNGTPATMTVSNGATVTADGTTTISASGLLDIDAPSAAYAKVNPPIRPREDVEYLWEKVLEGKVDWIVSDHACCSAEQKVDSENPQDIFLAKAGFGGTEYLLSGVFSEGSKRGMPHQQMAQMLSWNPARRWGLLTKGDIAVGYDADLVLLDPEESFVVRAAESPSSQGYTPFEGIELKGRVKRTFLRGELIYQDGKVLGEPRGKYMRRPYGEEPQP